VVSDVVEGLQAALSGWQEMQAQALAEGVQVDAEAAQVAAALDRARKLLA
jgi:CO/xanthine dehydrogenase Mo-binding subunit